MDNEFEPYQINRAALIVTAKKPFVDWLHKVDPTSKDVSLSDINHEPTFTWCQPLKLTTNSWNGWSSIATRFLRRFSMAGGPTHNHGLRIEASCYFRNGSNAACTRWFLIWPTSPFS
jgi:hypothetical protein